MLTLFLEEETYWDVRQEVFVPVNEPVVYKLMHCLKAISKWETKYKIPFFTADLTEEQTQYYIQCMEVDGKPIEWARLTNDQYSQITEHIMDSCTATSVKLVGDGEQTTMTSELMYALMAIHNIPFECDEWHFSRLNMLIQAVTFFKKDKKKMSKEQIQMSNAELNAQRRKELNSKG